MAFLFQENWRHGTNGQTDKHLMEGHIITSGM